MILFPSPSLLFKDSRHDTKPVSVTTSVTSTPGGKATASDFSPALGCFHTTLCLSPAPNTPSASPELAQGHHSGTGLSPQQSLQADAAKVLAGAHPPRWAKCPQHLQGAMTMHKFSLPDRHAQPGLRKLLFSSKCMLHFSRENCLCFF